MPSLKFIARRVSDRAFGTAFDRVIARAHARSHRTFLFFWNRGMGDIPLGLVPLFMRIRRELPAARIEVITRRELEAPFTLTGIDAVHVLPDLERESRVDLAAACTALGLDLTRFDATFDYPDPNRWLEGRRQAHAPRLSWNEAWDAKAGTLVPACDDRILIGAHVHSETARYYGYRKDWPAERWQELIARFPDREGVHWLLLGYEAQSDLSGDNVTDLRGRTDFPTLMSVVRNRCRVLVAPDSGILTMAYYLDAPFALDVVSLWSDPRQGVLRQGCPSPNPRLRHEAIVSPEEDIAQLPLETVHSAVRRALDSARRDARAP